MTAQPKPLRIKRLTLTDFRAFPGPAPVHFDLDGKNLLVYGENGSGKSSIFHALSGFFSLKPKQSLRKHKNVFSGQPETDCRVAVEFTEGGAAPVEWTDSKHPGDVDLSVPASDWYKYYFRNADSRVVATALRRTSLDYRALLDTNYKHGDGAVNLFDIAAEHLLRDFRVVVEGGHSATIGELWGKVMNAKPSQHKPAAIARINQACMEFNTAFRSAIPALLPHINALMQELGWRDVELKGLHTPGLTYNNARLKQNRAISGQELRLELTFRNHPLPVPQIFLNEARLSALALSIYLAGRLACTPTATQDALKLLVLDDVLIGLDHANRLPVLDVLHTRFADWQVVLLTHDKTWFDLARGHLREDDWACCEIYEGDTAATAPMPIVRLTRNKPARALLQKATDLLALGYVEAAANYARQAFELGLRAACELKRIHLIYRQDPTAHQAQDLLDALKGWQVTGSLKQADWDAAIHRLELLKNVVMNPYSHPSSPNIPKQEVTDAIEAVTTFLDLAAKK
jgi:energy-coupling factor transporter ATP-binding protein EcfA2